MTVTSQLIGHMNGGRNAPEKFDFARQPNSKQLLPSSK